MPFESGKITVKAMCVVVRNGKEVLATPGVDSIKKESFGRLIGGGIEFGETSEKALQREFMEELGTRLENLVFLRVVENVFTYDGKPGHHIVFLYRGDLVDKSIYAKEEMTIVDKAIVKASWISLDDVKKGKIKLYPELDYEKLI